MKPFAFGCLAATLLITTTAAGTLTGPARVIDGDTVVVGDTHVRLKGVDAAELGTPLGEHARQVMETIVTGPLTCTLTGEHTWRREVGYCTTEGGVDINQAIIARCRAGVPALLAAVSAVRAGHRTGRATSRVLLRAAMRG